MASRLLQAAQTLTRGPMTYVCYGKVHTTITNVSIISGTVIGAIAEGFGPYHDDKPGVRGVQMVVGGLNGSLRGYIYGYCFPITIPYLVMKFSH